MLNVEITCFSDEIALLDEQLKKAEEEAKACEERSNGVLVLNISLLLFLVLHN